MVRLYPILAVCGQRRRGLDLKIGQDKVVATELDQAL